MADHLDAPGLMSPNGNAKTDITDIYAFQKPGDDDKSILILNVNPLAPTLATEFESNGLYQLKIDTDADALAEVAFRIEFTPVVNGQQWATVRRAVGGDADDDENSGEIIIKHASCLSVARLMSLSPVPTSSLPESVVTPSSLT